MTSAHGRFDAEARSRSWQLWAKLHRSLVGAIAIGIGGAMAAYTMSQWRKRAA